MSVLEHSDRLINELADRFKFEFESEPIGRAQLLGADGLAPIVYIYGDSLREMVDLPVLDETLEPLDFSVSPAGTFLYEMDGQPGHAYTWMTLTFGSIDTASRYSQRPGIIELDPIVNQDYMVETPDDEHEPDHELLETSGEPLVSQVNGMGR